MGSMGYVIIDKFYRIVPKIAPKIFIKSPEIATQTVFKIVISGPKSVLES